MDVWSGARVATRLAPRELEADRVLLVTGVPDERTAWSKARRDVLELMAEQGYQVLHVPEGASPRAWLKLLADLRANTGEGGQVVIEYPFPRRRRAWLLHLLCRARRTRLHALIHDLDSLRFEDSPRSREVAVLRLFDGLISHNPAMTAWLRQAGVDKRVEEIQLFDYIGQPGRHWHEERAGSPLKVVFAGNLAYGKSRWIYDERLSAIPGLALSIFGQHYEPGRVKGAGVRYQGVFDPQAPVLDGPHHFGLVWDGDRIDTCDGNYGHYMRFNNPHKLSLYLCMGLPVIVWREAAIARLVEAQGIGLAVADLREIGGIATSLDDEAYRRMCRNARRVGGQVRRGDFLRQALERLEPSRIR